MFSEIRRPVRPPRAQNAGDPRHREPSGGSRMAGPRSGAKSSNIRKSEYAVSSQMVGVRRARLPLACSRGLKSRSTANSRCEYARCPAGTHSLPSGAQAFAFARNVVNAHALALGNPRSGRRPRLTRGSGRRREERPASFDRPENPAQRPENPARQPQLPTVQFTKRPQTAAGPRTPAGGGSPRRAGIPDAPD